MTMTIAPDLRVLSNEMLERFWARDSDVEHLGEDFELLSRAGFFLSAVPVEFGGLGGNLLQACDQQRRLAQRAPATAMAASTHISWTGVAADLYRSGDASLAWLLEAAVAGEIFSDQHWEVRNDDAFVRGYLTWTQCLFASVLLGIADRALELSVAEAKRRSTVHLIAEMALEVEAASSLAEHVAHDWTTGVDHGNRWTAKLAAVQRQAISGARRVVELALEAAGESPSPELERLDRDVRAFDPPESLVGLEIVGRAVLGLP